MNLLSNRRCILHRRPGTGGTPFPSGFKRREGIAIVLVLAFLVLITVLIVTFFSSVTTELSGARAYASETSTKQLADSAVQIVVGTIAQATASGTNVAWASQPGMIRTYGDGNGNASGAPLACYKLYSSDNMVVTKNQMPFDPADPSNPEVDPQWNAKPALYTDLNSPIVCGTSAVFPIIDGNGIKSLNQTLAYVSGTAATATYTSGSTYLGYDGDGDGAPDVDGFAIDPAKVAYTPSSPPSVTNNPVPMPVKWIYVLQDGTLTVPSGTTSGTIADFSGSSNPPTADNPITGRIAFWADDETCKVNINTASQGTYWDTPRVCDSTGHPEMDLSQYSPMQHEYQRYPGHPATTCLSAVFKNLDPESVYRMIPRLGPGGSQEGTVKTTALAATGTAPVVNMDRLYATVDEFLFKPTVSGTRPQNDAVNLTATAFERARFFVTAGSRSPDLNLFGMPRVCMWPESFFNDASHRSPYDQLIAFCSTVNGSPYYFQRKDSTDPNEDLPDPASKSGLGRNRMLLEYLRTLTTQNIPGFGGNFAAKYATKNSKGTGTDRDQILTEMFDYIRSTNLNAPNPGVGSGWTPYTIGNNGDGTSSVGIGQVVPIDDVRTDTHGFGRFRAVQGGAFLFIANADSTTNPVPTPDLVLGGTTPAVATGNTRVQACFIPQLFDPSLGAVFDNPDFGIVITGLDSYSLGTKNLGFPHTIYVEHAAYCVDSGGFYGDQMGIRQLMFFAGANLVGGSVDLPSVSDSAVFTGGNVTITIQTGTNATHPNTVVQTGTLSFPSNVPIRLPHVFRNYDSTIPAYLNDVAATGTAATGTSGFYQNWTNATTINTAKGDFFNMRRFAYDGKYGGLQYHGRLKTAANSAVWFVDVGNTSGTCQDVVRSVSVAHGDTRLVAAQKTVPSSAYSPVGDYANHPDLAVDGAHNFWDGIGNTYYGARAGYLVANAKYDGYTSSTLKVNAFKFDHNSSIEGMRSALNLSDGPFNGVALGGTSQLQSGDTPGDWDNGVGIIRDGPYINKPDEGDSGMTSGGSSQNPYDWKLSNLGAKALTITQFTPNRLIPSAVMFGSLPTGVFANRPWQTLLFRPDPIGTHPGGKDRKGDGTAAAGMPADHLLLDLFEMPVVEPYPISEPLTTAGQINMNYQIVPFTYMTRSTGIAAVLESEKVISILDSQANTYKKNSTSSQLAIRFPVDINETLKGFTSRFNTKDIFHSASEICTLPIVPKGATFSQLSDTAIATNYWTTPTNGHRLTGDNSRERPYATIYPRLTTKSNTFTVHFRVQSLKKSKTGTPDKWDESKDAVLSEYRGSQTIERYVDPSDSRIPDYASNTGGDSIDAFYRFRVLSAKKFTAF